MARMEVVRPGPEALEAILKRCGIVLDRAPARSALALSPDAARGERRLNLTRIHNFENMVLKHYVDSLLVLRFVELPSPLIDMGSGPGLPGIPLKIARPEVRMILAEPRGARAEFLARGLRAARARAGRGLRPQGRPGLSRARWPG